MFDKKQGDEKSGKPEGNPVRATGATTSAAPAGASPDPQRAMFRYVDRPECVETFADTILGLFFDGQALRIEFGVTRLDDRQGNAPITGRRYPACRLVLPPNAAVDLINKMQQVGAALAQAGLVKTNPNPADANKPK